MYHVYHSLHVCLIVCLPVCISLSLCLSNCLHASLYKFMAVCMSAFLTVYSCLNYQHASLCLFMAPCLFYVSQFACCLFVCLAIPVHVVCLSFRLTVCMPVLVFMPYYTRYRCMLVCVFTYALTFCVSDSLYSRLSSVSLCLTVSVCLSVYNSNLNQDTRTDSKAYSHKHLL